jgi:hypothetical protein
LIEACEFCDQPENHEPIITALARPEYVGVAESALRHGITGEMDFGHGTERTVGDFCLFHRDHANEPSGDKAAWVLELVRTSGLCPEPAAINFALGRKTFRPDIFQKAAALSQSAQSQPKNKFENETIFA